MDGLGVPGFAVAVVKDGRLYALDAMGPRDPRTGAPIDGDTMFYVASITKTIRRAEPGDSTPSVGCAGGGRGGAGRAGHG